MKVLKRNGDIVEYNGEKIKSAIKSAMNDIGLIDKNEELCTSIESTISLKIKDSELTWSVEKISDTIENELMDFGEYDVAKEFILYRNKRKELRILENKTEYKFLSKDFLKKYKHKIPPMTELGTLIYYRTYSRFLPDLKRREYWRETVARVVDYNIGLGRWKSHNEAVTEAELMYDNVFNLRQFPSGRSLWSAGTETSYTMPISQYNCSYANFDSFEITFDIAYLLMLGVGFGFSVEKEHIERLPKVRSSVKIVHQDYSPVPKNTRKEVTEYTITDNVMEVVVGDSKIGWARAIELLTRVFYHVEFKHVTNLMIDYNNVRPFGEELKTFGGRASGHEALKTILKKITNVIVKNNEDFKKLRPVDAMDIATIIAEGIVVGGTRRSAEMCLSSDGDKEMMNAKMELYKQDINGNWIANQDLLHRMMSNNSTMYWEKPTYSELKKRFEIIKHSAENNFFNGEQAKKRFESFSGTNPCGEILLDSHQFCNLVTLVIPNFIKDGKLEKEKLLDAQRLNTRISYRVTIPTLELPKWDYTQKRDRLLGLSLTGWQDAMNILGYTMEEQGILLQDLREVAWEEMKRYADSMNLSHSKLITSVKPEGTLSQLPTVSSGVHMSHSPYYVRRVRMNAEDELIKVCEELGYPIYPEVGQTEENCNTKVVEFPVKAPGGRTKYTVSAIEQLEIYKLFMEKYVDHNASNTISVRPDEWNDVVDWVYNNWDTVVGVTFISLDDSFYKLLPYEAINKDEYDKRKSKMRLFNPDLLLKYNIKESSDEDLVDAECSTGACPIR